MPLFRKSQRAGLILGMALVLSVAPLVAGEELVGTTSANFLKIPVMARPAAMGEAFTALADDASSLSYNPAGPARTLQSHFNASHVSWFQGINIEQIAGVIPLGTGAAIGAGFTWLQVDDLTRTKRVANSNNPLANYVEIGSFRPYDYAASLSLALKTGEHWNTGIGARVIGQGIDDAKGYGVAFDAGLVRSGYFGWLDLGLALQNIGSGIAVGGTAFAQPLIVRGGAAARLMQRKLALSLDGVMANDQSVVPEVGAEYWMHRMVAARLGWRGGYASQFTAGAGFRFGALEIDYAWQPYTELGDTHRVTAGVSWGQPGAKIRAWRPLLGPVGEAAWRRGGFVPEAARPDAVAAWKVQIVSPGGAIERVFGGSGIPPRIVEWDGRDSRGRVLPDGIFRGRLFVDYGGGLQASAQGGEVELDSTPPVVAMKMQPTVARPDSSGALLIPAQLSVFGQDKHGIGGWKIEIRDAKQQLFRAFSGEGSPPLAVEWDGTDGKGKSFQTGATAYILPFAKDGLGNWGQGQGQAMPVLLREVHFDIASDALFEVGKADVRISAYNTLKQVKAQIMEHYQTGTTVDIIGHTDDRPTVLSAYDGNEALSEARAKAVIKFLVTLLEMDPAMFKPIGMGGTIPKVSNDTPEGREANRRVEVVIHAMKYE